MSFGDKCKYCGCTEERACIDKFGNPCFWIMHEICSECFDKCTDQEKRDWLAIIDFVEILEKFHSQTHSLTGNVRVIRLTEKLNKFGCFENPEDFHILTS